MNFTKKSQIEAATNKELVDYYNEHNKDNQLPRFRDRAAAERRCIDLMNSLKDAKKAAFPKKAAIVPSVPPVAKVEEPKATVEAAKPDPVAEKKPEPQRTTPAPDSNWPFNRENEQAQAERNAASETPAQADSATAEKPSTKKAPQFTAGNAIGIAASWADPVVYASRIKRNEVVVMIDGGPGKVYRSTCDAFKRLGLMANRHGRFRTELKKTGERVYEEGGKSYRFKIV